MSDDGRMKVRLSQDERWPTYLMSDEYGRHEVEVDAETLARWKATEDAYNAAQDEMADLYDAAERVAREQAALERAEKKAREKAEREEREKARNKAAEVRKQALQRLRDAGPLLYDSDGNPVGRLVEGNFGAPQVYPLED